MSAKLFSRGRWHRCQDCGNTLDHGTICNCQGTTANQAIQNALLKIHTNRDDRRQAFRDRIQSLAFPANREPAAVDGLIAYAVAIETDEENQALTEAVEAVVREMSPEDKAELNEILSDRIQWGSPQDTPRYPLWCKAFELTKE